MAQMTIKNHCERSAVISEDANDFSAKEQMQMRYTEDGAANRKDEIQRSDLNRTFFSSSQSLNTS